MNIVLKTNLTCGACVRKITPGMDELPSVKQWSADMEDPRKLIRVEVDDDGDTAGVLAVIAKAGFEAEVIAGESSRSSTALHSIGVDSTRHESATKTPFRLATYRPLFLVVCYILGLTVFSEILAGGWDWQRSMAHFMGFFFLGFAFFKLLNVGKFADAFSTYDIVAKRSRVYGLSYPFVEVGLGLLFLSQRYLGAASVLTAVLMVVGLVGVVSAVRKKQAIQCACLGTAFQLPMSFVTIIENTVMLLMAIVMLI